MKKVFKYATGETVPDNAIYLWSTKNGLMNENNGYEFVWHYFLVEVKE
jgi:hypothetical protein